jgi:hypothetical protein
MPRLGGSPNLLEALHFFVGGIVLVIRILFHYESRYD